MNTFLIILLIAAMLATVAMLVRGLVIFLMSASAEAKGEKGPSSSALKSNKAMQYRIFFQAIAIALVAIILLLAQKN
ncbi:MAG: twin transmembrane helix small protein [Sphingomonas sp.]|jgi:heme/copper-type cytochrome/quinol oxidase subunit 2|uniref:twin transmembrane helix small protein n=1 Tax=Sphingomonas sp. TaxID=28214 RepID=UPI00356AC3D6